MGRRGKTRLAHPEEELYAMVFDQERAGSLAYTLHALYRVAGSVRDRISMDMWRILSSQPPEEPFNPANPPTLSDVLDRLNQRVGRAKQERVAAAPRKVREIAWKAQSRLNRRYRALLRRGKLKTVAITAVARELAGFVWAVAREATAQAAAK